MRLILASTSPRRAELLRAAGYEFDTRVADVDEGVRAAENATEYVRRVSLKKAHAVAGQLTRSQERCVVLAADTSVVVDGEILGKPANRADAARMLKLLSGRSHEVLTGVCLLTVSDTNSDTTSDTAAEVASTTVWFSPLSQADLDWYLATGEWVDKAGGYGIQGFASRFIPRIDGSYSNVVGLPVATVETLLKSLKIPNFR